MIKLDVRQIFTNVTTNADVQLFAVADLVLWTRIHEHMWILGMGMGIVMGMGREQINVDEVGMEKIHENTVGVEIINRNGVSMGTIYFNTLLSSHNTTEILLLSQKHLLRCAFL